MKGLCIMDTVEFTRMQDGTAEEYAFLERLEQEYAAELPRRIEAQLLSLANSLSGYRVNRLEHSLQSATRAWRDGRSRDYIVAALIRPIRASRCHSSSRCSKRYSPVNRGLSRATVPDS